VIFGRLWVACGATHWDCRLLRLHCKRQCRRTAEQRDERAALHSITSSARASRVGGTAIGGYSEAICNDCETRELFRLGSVIFFLRRHGRHSGYACNVKV
jgi:hypothetical protein